MRCNISSVFYFVFILILLTQCCQTSSLLDKLLEFEYTREHPIRSRAHRHIKDPRDPRPCYISVRKLPCSFEYWKMPYYTLKQ